MCKREGEVCVVVYVWREWGGGGEEAERKRAGEKESESKQSAE